MVMAKTTKTTKKQAKKPSGKTRKNTSARTVKAKKKKTPASKETTSGEKTPAKKIRVTARKSVANTKKKASKKNSPPKALTAREKRKCRDNLLGLRERLLGQVSALTKESLERNDSVVSPEDGTDAFDRQFALNIASSEQNAVVDIDAALRRLEEGTYGVCEKCDEHIEVPRLQALPFVRLCVKCQSEEEQNMMRYRYINRR